MAGTRVSHDVGHNIATVTPSNDVDLKPHRALWVSVEGTVTVMARGGGTVALGTLPVGTMFPCRVKRVMATGTTATVLRIA